MTPTDDNSAALERAETDAILSAIPPGRPLSLAGEALGLLLGNGIVLWYLARGEMTPLQLVLLVLLEALILTVLARTHRLLVPAAARIGGRERVQIHKLLFGLVWLAIVYFVVALSFIDVTQDLAALRADPLAFLWQPQLRWPLLLTALGALVDMVGDQGQLRKTGFLVSTPEFSGMARWLTLFLGAIPFFVPILVLGLGIAGAAKLLRERMLQADTLSLFLVIGLLTALPLGLTAIVYGLFAAGVAGWAIGFVTAKLASEAFVVAIPPLLARMRAQEAQPQA